MILTFDILTFNAYPLVILFYYLPCLKLQGFKAKQRYRKIAVVGVDIYGSVTLRV